ncbi:TonB-dependent siderophore receptor [Marinifilum sp.]|uniref:TonB-dependent siderophore receptor n=1 Tax=Marinifilum sp. TaxID=2033137 RepID=UPI003BA87C25
MIKRLSVLLIALLCLPAAIWAQQSVTGFVLDQDSGNPIEGANLYLKKLKLGTTSKKDGSFEFINVPSGKCQLNVSFVGYENYNRTIDTGKKHKSITIKLKRAVTILDGVDISAKAVRETEEVLKLAAPLKDIPLTTSTVSIELMEQTQVTTINDALKYATGIKPVVNYGGFQTFKMRGFGAPVIMLDGARDERMNFSNSAPLTSLASVERIEYLKGPASVLYGHSAVGGILNIVRKQPSNTFNANASLSYGSWDTKRTALGFGNKLNEKLSYRFDGSFSDSKGWRDASEKTLNGYLAVNYNLDDRNALEFKIGANNDIYGTETGLPVVKNDVYSENDQLLYRKGDLPTNFDREQRYNDPADFLKHKNVNASVKYIGKVGSKSNLKIHASYTNDVIDYFSTEAIRYLTSDSPIYNNYYLNGDGSKTYISLDSLRRAYPFRFMHRTKTYQNYIDYQTKLETGSLKHKINVGHFFMYVDRISYTGYSKEDIYYGGVAGDYVDVRDATVSIVDPVWNQGGLRSKFSGARIYREMVNGLYFQDLIEVSDKLNFLAAIRYDNYHMERQTSGISRGRNKIDKTPTKTIVNNALTYRLGVVYQPNDDLSLYSSYSSFFKPKRTVYNENYAYLDKNGIQFFPKDGEELFEPEDGYQIEAGVKYDWNNKVQLNASAYYIKKNNIVENLGEVVDGKVTYGQVGVVDSKGFDIDFIYKPSKDWNTTFGYSYNVAKFRKFSNSKYKTNAKAGNSVRKNPENRVFVWTHYQVPKGLLKNLSLGAGFDYTDAVFTSSSNDYELPSYCLVDASLGYKFDKMYIKLKINNIFDENYYSSGIWSNQFIPGQGRNTMFTIGMDF